MEFKRNIGESTFKISSFNVSYFLDEKTAIDYAINNIGGYDEAGCYNSAPLNLGSAGVLHGNLTMLLQTADGQIEPSHSISAGLDYPGVGPEHAYLHATGRAEYGLANDAQALHAFQTLCGTEGILPALESSHALAYVLEHPETFPAGGEVVVNLSGRGDKDMDIVREALCLNSL